MSQTVWKFELETSDQQTIRVPQGARFLKLDVQYGNPVCWMLVDRDNQKVDFKIRIVGTDRPANIGNTYVYLGTYQMVGGALVFHAFGKWVE